MRKGDYIGTYSGRHFWPLDPWPEEVTLEDITHALSNICRFNGHTNRFYSVAEHSLNVAWLLKRRGASPKIILYGLLHDAAEAYVCDIPRPLKRFLEGYKDIENEVMLAIYGALKLMEPAPYQKAMIDIADNYILALEAKELMRKTEGWDLVNTELNDHLPHWDCVCSTFSAEISLLLFKVRGKSLNFNPVG